MPYLNRSRPAAPGQAPCICSTATSAGNKSAGPRGNARPVSFRAAAAVSRIHTIADESVTSPTFTPVACRDPTVSARTAGASPPTATPAAELDRKRRRDTLRCWLMGSRCEFARRASTETRDSPVLWLRKMEPR